MTNHNNPDPPPPRGPCLVRSNPLRAALRLALCVGWTAVLSPWLIFGIALQRDRRRRVRRSAMIVHWWSAGLMRCSGVAIRVRGKRPPEGSLIAANHVSYMDILAMGSATPTLFLSKREIADWFFLGFLLRRTEHPLTSRLAGREVKHTVSEVQERLETGRRVTIFLEGTTTAGDRVLAFVPTLIEPAIAAAVDIVPAAIRYRVTDRRLSVRDDVAYWRDDTFVPHLWRLMGLNGVQVEVMFGEPVPAEGRRRRELAAEARREIVGMLGVPDGPDQPEWDGRPWMRKLAAERAE